MVNDIRYEYTKIYDSYLLVLDFSPSRDALAGESSSASSYARDTGANVKTGSDTDLPELDGDHERFPYADHSLT